MNAIGALLLAWRVKNILDTLVEAQEFNDINIQAIISILKKENSNVPLIYGMASNVKNEQKKGILLLVFGFILIAIGNILVGLSWYFE